MDKASGPDAPQQIDEPAVSNDDKQKSQAKPANSEASSVAGLEPSNDDVSPLAAAKLSGAIPKSDSAASRDSKTPGSSTERQSTIQTVSAAHLSSEGADAKIGEEDKGPQSTEEKSNISVSSQSTYPKPESVATKVPEKCGIAADGTAMASEATSRDESTALTNQQASRAESAVPSSTGSPSTHEREREGTSYSAKSDKVDSEKVFPELSSGLTDGGGGDSVCESTATTKGDTKEENKVTSTNGHGESTVPSAVESLKHVESSPSHIGGGDAGYHKANGDQSAEKKQEMESHLDNAHAPLKTTVLADGRSLRTREAKGYTDEGAGQSNATNVQPAESIGKDKEPAPQDTRPKSSIPPPAVYDKPSRSATVERKLPEETAGTVSKTNGLLSEHEIAEPALETTIETSKQVEVDESIRPQQACYTGTTDPTIPTGAPKVKTSELPTALDLPSDIIDEEAIKAQLYALTPESADSPLERGQIEMAAGLMASDKRGSPSEQLIKDALQGLPKPEQATSELEGKLPSPKNAEGPEPTSECSEHEDQKEKSRFFTQGKPTVSEKTGKERDNEEAQERRLSESKLDFEEKGRLEAGKAEKSDSATGEKADIPEKTKKESELVPLEHPETATKDNKSEEAKLSSDKTESNQSEGRKSEKYDEEKGLEEKDEKDEKYAKEVDVKESGENEELKHEPGKNLVSTSPGGTEHLEPGSRDNQNESRKKEDTSDRCKDLASPQPDKNGHADASPSNKEVESTEEKETAQDVLKEDKSSKDVREEEEPADISRAVTGDEVTERTASAQDAPTKGEVEEANNVQEEETSEAKGMTEASEKESLVDTIEPLKIASFQDEVTVEDLKDERKVSPVDKTVDSIDTRTEIATNEGGETAETGTEHHANVKVSEVDEGKEAQNGAETKAEDEIDSKSKDDGELKPESKPPTEDQHASAKTDDEKATEPSDELVLPTTEDSDAQKQDETEAPDEGQELAVPSGEQAAEASVLDTEAAPESELSAVTAEDVDKVETTGSVIQEAASEEQQGAEPGIEEAPSEVEAAPVCEELVAETPAASVTAEPPQVKKKTSLPKSPSKRATGKVPPRSLDKKEPPATSDAKSKAPGSPKKPTSIPDKGSPSPKKSAAPPKNEVTSPSKTARTPGADQKKLPPIKAPVGQAPKPDLKNVRSKIGSLDNIKHKPKGGEVKVQSKKLEWRATPKVGSLDNAAHRPGGGDKKILSQKVDFKAQSKVGSLDNVDHKPTGGAVKVETQKLDFKDKATPRVGSMDNVKHKAGGGDVKILSEKLEFKERAASKIGSLPASDTGSTRGSESQSPTNLTSPQPQHGFEEVAAANGHDDSDVSPTKEETSAVPPGAASVLAAPEVAQC
ncbi:microtubule-associated protein tau [Ixodes scapularis]|uniref:microtubule-associated protein tau n=1 Tax=Ixodes scapularis TaxID=6945 RepID=UPI001A9ED93D|nr:microtubule-associated protein tau [Ixodes scapularis]